MKFNFEPIKNLRILKAITDFLQKNYFLVGLLILSIINLFILNGVSDRTKELALAVNKTDSNVVTVKASLKEHEEITSSLFFNTSTAQKKISDENFDLTKALNQILSQVSSTDDYFKKLDAQSKTIPSTAEKHVETITLK